MSLAWIFGLLFLVSCGYQLFATYCAISFSQRSPKDRNQRLRFCQVKPVHTPALSTLALLDDFLAQSASFEHDVYICSSKPAPDDWLIKQDRVTWLRLNSDQSRNGKAATLALAQHYWSGDIFIISDADMSCSAEYLDAVLGEFADPKVGVVTCLYRALPGKGLGNLLESLCITDFCTSVLVAEKTEGVGFAMGSTMAIRREVLEQIGGFEALEAYLADDFQLGYRASQKGWRVAIAPTVLGTKVDGANISGALSHQYRWLVTSRVSRPVGHFLFIVTQGLLWSVLFALSTPGIGSLSVLMWCLLRWATGYMQAEKLAPPQGSGTPWQWIFLPAKDVLYLGIWVSSLWGSSVRWGDRVLSLDSEGRIIESH